MSTPTPPPQPEFNEKQNELIRDLSNAMTWASIPFLVIGCLYLVGLVHVVVEAFTYSRMWGIALYLLLPALFSLAIGSWTSRAAGSFRKITETSGQDMNWLMDALAHLRNLYALLRLLVMIYVAFLVLALVIGIVTYFTMGKPVAA